MPETIDPEFYNRADSFINLANEHIANIGRGKVSASFMYAVSRFNAWISACGFENGSDMSEAKEETIEYFVKQYRAMLEDNLDDYVDKFNEYMKSPSKGKP